mgnify:CR=1 FL=1
MLPCAAFDAIAFGCPAMGTEVLEEGKFEPMFTVCLNCPARPSPCSAPMAGATASGCASGRRPAPVPARSWPETAVSTPAKKELFFAGIFAFLPEMHNFLLYIYK